MFVWFYIKEYTIWYNLVSIMGIGIILDLDKIDQSKILAQHQAARSAFNRNLSFVSRQSISFVFPPFSSFPAFEYKDRLHCN